MEGHIANMILKVGKASHIRDKKAIYSLCSKQLRLTSFPPALKGFKSLEKDSNGGNKTKIKSIYKQNEPRLPFVQTYQPQS